MTDGPYRKPANIPQKTRYFVLISYNRADGAASTYTCFADTTGDRLDALEAALAEMKISRSAAWHWEVISAADFEKAPS